MNLQLDHALALVTASTGGNNLLYYKRLDPEAFVILTALSRRVTGRRWTAR
jgi:hypothetical protein